MLFVVFTACLFGVVSAAPGNPAMPLGVMLPTAAPASSGCCMSNKFTATLVQVGATLPANSMDPTILDSSSVIDYDYGMKMLRLQMNQRDQNTGMMNKLDVFIDYTSMKTYTVVAGNCYVTPMQDAMTEPCVGNGTFMGTHKIGTGANTLTVDGWMMMSGGMMRMMMIQADTCTPVSMQTYGDNMDGSKELMSYNFVDVMEDTYSTGDRSPFVMPDSCKNAVMPPVGK